MRERWQHLLAIGLLGGLAACASGTINKVPTALPHHIVMVDKFGNLTGKPLADAPCDVVVDPDHPPVDLDYRQPLCAAGTSVQDCDRVIEAQMRAQVDHIIRCTPEKNHKRRIVVFIHGGLNHADGELVRADTLARRIWADKDKDGVYPIFINWNSAFLSSYSDRLLFVRQGRYTSEAYYAPAYLLNDAARAVGRSILTAGQLVRNDYEGSILCPNDSLCKEDAGKVADRLKGEGYPVSAPVVMSQPPTTESWLSGLSWFVTLPIQWLTGPIIDSAGSAAWDVMWRRTTGLVYRDEDLDVVNGASPLKARGGMARFLNALADRMDTLKKKEPNEAKKWEVVLVGHSMGAIVMNEVVRGWGERLPITDVVYMAAACTIRDYQDTIWPFLDHARTTGAQVPRVHHLMLHPKAEAQDIGLAWPAFVPYLFPRGSLLVWLDGFLTNPATPIDLVAGRFTNIMRTIENTPPAIREAIDFRTFEHRREHVHEHQPQSHGSFGDFVNYWKPECWGNGLSGSEWEEHCWHTEPAEVRGAVPNTGQP